MCTASLLHLVLCHIIPPEEILRAEDYSYGICDCEIGHKTNFNSGSNIHAVACEMH